MTVRVTVRVRVRVRTATVTLYRAYKETHTTTDISAVTRMLIIY